MGCDQHYSLHRVERNSKPLHPSPPWISRNRECWKNEAKPRSPRRQWHCCSGLIFKPVTCPALIQHKPPGATNIDKRFKSHVVGKGLFSLGRSQADISHMVISLLALPYGEDISCITFSKRMARWQQRKGNLHNIIQTQVLGYNLSPKDIHSAFPFLAKSW